MKFSIIVSKTDIAGMNAKQILVEEKGFKETSREFDGNKVFEFHNSLGEFELITLEEVQIFADKVNDLETDFLVFASKHANKSGQAEFTVHALANWGKAEYGGKDKNVCKSSGVLMRNYFEGLEKFRKEFGLEEYRVALEADHHGPWVSEKPVVFIEFGGSEKQWADKNAARVLVETILSCTKLENLQNWIPAIGLGGTHYCDNFVKVLQRSNYCFSHICPKYGLPEFDENSLQQCLEKSAEKIQAIVLDAKGLADKERIKKIVAETGLQIVKTEQLTK